MGLIAKFQIYLARFPSLVDGKPKAFHVLATLVEQVRKEVEMRDRFDAAAATICGINLRRFLKQKEDR